MAQRDSQKKGNPFDALAALKKAAVVPPAADSLAAKAARAAAERTAAARAAADQVLGKKTKRVDGSVVLTPRVEPSDAELFAREVAGTAPIERRVTRVGAPPPEPRLVARPSEDAEVLAQLADLCDGDGVFDISDSDEFIEGVADGVDKRLLRRLRGGDYAVQAHVDLHGMTRDEARDKVSRFLADSRKAGHRCVLLVHGRGLHSKDQIPVLKQAVRTWLERGAVARLVLAFATARPTDGGAGAVYVLLRR